MNKWAAKTSEDARRLFQAADAKSKHRQNEILKERAQILAVEVRKTENLRALRLAKEAAEKLAAEQAVETKKPVKSKKKRIVPPQSELPSDAAAEGDANQES